jgi:hypothetical protein
MAERLRTNDQQNWEERNYCSFGPNFRIDSGNPQMGISGENVYSMYGVTNSGEQCLLGLNQGGGFRILTDRSVEISAGNKSQEEGVDIALNALNGGISLTAIGNGAIQIKAKNIILEASEDIDLKAGRNMTLTAGTTMKLDAMEIEVDGLFGNLIETVLGTFGTQVFAGTSALEGASIGIGGGLGAATNIAGSIAGVF